MLAQTLFLFRGALREPLKALSKATGCLLANHAVGAKLGKAHGLRCHTVDTGERTGGIATEYTGSAGEGREIGSHLPIRHVQHGYFCAGGEFAKDLDATRT